MHYRKNIENDPGVSSKNSFIIHKKKKKKKTIFKSLLNKKFMVNFGLPKIFSIWLTGSTND